MKHVISIFLTVVLMLSLVGCELPNLGGSNETEPASHPVLGELVDLSQAERKETVYFDYYILRDVTEEQARAYEQSFVDNRYEKRAQGWVNGTEETNFASYLLGGDLSTVLCFYKDTLVLCQSRMQPKDGDMWLLAGAPAELLPVDSISTEEDYILLDTSAAQNQMIGEYDAKVIPGVTWNAVNNYGFWLQCRQGYEYSSYFDNPTVEDYRYIESFYHQEGDEHLLTILAWEDDTAVIIEISANDIFDEYALWNWFGSAVMPGVTYLENLWHSIGMSLGSGNGFDSTGYYYNFTSGADASDFESFKQKLIGLGFTEEVIEVNQDGYMEYTAARYDDFGGRQYAIWYQLILDGDYLEAEVGFSVQEGSHKD